MPDRPRRLHTGSGQPVVGARRAYHSAYGGLEILRDLVRFEGFRPELSPWWSCWNLATFVSRWQTTGSVSTVGRADAAGSHVPS
jgi:hypothetical protein